MKIVDFPNVTLAGQDSKVRDAKNRKYKTVFYMKNS